MFDEGKFDRVNIQSRKSEDEQAKDLRDIEGKTDEANKLCISGGREWLDHRLLLFNGGTIHKIYAT